MDKIQAKKALDNIIKKSRVHLYKPIQIAEILYKYREDPSMDLLNLESYRTKSRKWRDVVSLPLLGRVCTSSAKFQDDLFNATAMPPNLLNVLGKENNRTGGAVEAYIYDLFNNKHSQLEDALNYCLLKTRDSFSVRDFIDAFWHEPGLKRSLDKIYEIIVYALFSTILEELEMKVEVSINQEKKEILDEFKDFTKGVLNLDFSQPFFIQQARIFRVGVTNAADRGLDMYANWGPAIQIKHLALDEELAGSIVESVSSDKIVIVCKSAEQKLIVSLVNQLGMKSKIQSVITEDDLVLWYEKALRGKYAHLMGNKLLGVLANEISIEFPSVDTQDNIITARNYGSISETF